MKKYEALNCYSDAPNFCQLTCPFFCFRYRGHKSLLEDEDDGSVLSFMSEIKRSKYGGSSGSVATQSTISTNLHSTKSSPSSTKSLPSPHKSDSFFLLDTTPKTSNQGGGSMPGRMLSDESDDEKNQSLESDSFLLEQSPNKINKQGYDRPSALNGQKDTTEDDNCQCQKEEGQPQFKAAELIKVWENIWMQEQQGDEESRDDQESDAAFVNDDQEIRETDKSLSDANFACFDDDDNIQTTVDAAVPTKHSGPTLDVFLEHETSRHSKDYRIKDGERIRLDVTKVVGRRGCGARSVASAPLPRGDGSVDGAKTATTMTRSASVGRRASLKPNQKDTPNRGRRSM